MAKTDPQKRKAGTMLLVGAAGVLLGALSALTFVSGHRFETRAAESSRQIAYVPVQRMTLPVVDRDGRLASYMNIDFALEVPMAKRVFVRQRVPEVRHAVNVAAWKTRLIAVDAGALDIEETRAMLLRAARAALGRDSIEQVRILSAVPI